MPPVVTKAFIVGAGTSASVPKLGCVVKKKFEDGRGPCKVCEDAFVNGPSSKNHRLNPSFFVIISDERGSASRNVLVDCGKTFRESAIKVLAPNGIKEIHSVLLTHEHADAASGVDDLREFSAPKQAIVVHCDTKTENYLRGAFPYLFQPAKTWVASIEWRTFSAELESPVDSVVVEGLTVGVIPVIHHCKTKGTCNAFVFPLASGDALVYMSDVSELSDSGVAAVHAQAARAASPTFEGNPIRVLVLDMLGTKENPVHFTVEQALETATRIGARETVFVGMSCDLDFTAHTAVVQAVNPSFSLGYDGRCLFDAAIDAPTK